MEVAGRRQATSSMAMRTFIAGPAHGKRMRDSIFSALIYVYRPSGVWMPCRASSPKLGAARSIWKRPREIGQGGKHSHRTSKYSWGVHLCKLSC